MLDRYQQLLLDILHKDTEKPDRTRFPAFEACDWDLFISAAIRHRLACQLDDYLSSHPDVRKLAPTEGLQRLGETVQKQFYNNVLQVRRLRKVLTACEQAGLPVILFKGLWLVEHIYGDLRARPSGDIDLLVRPEDMADVTRLARTIGCVVPEGTEDLRLLRPASNEYPLMYRDNETCLDVHWTVARPPGEKAIDEESIWTRSEATTTANARCRMFRLEDHLLYLCFHTAIHHKFVYVGPRAFVDIARFIRHPPREIDWEDVVRRAQALGWSRGVWLTLDLVREHLGAAPPDFVLDRLQPAILPSADLREAAMDVLFLDQADTMFWSLARLKNARWRDKPSILYQRLFPEREEIARQYNAPLRSPGFIWLYARRLWRLSFYLPLFAEMVLGRPARLAEEARMTRVRDWLAE